MRGKAGFWYFKSVMALASGNEMDGISRNYISMMPFTTSMGCG
jgi:hypothetical protein